MAATETKPRFVLAIDQGTTSTRACLFARDGSIAAMHQVEFTQYTNTQGWVEHDAEEIWDTVVTTVTGAMQAAGATSADVAAVGITNQRETSVVWSADTGRPLRRAIVWQDGRSADICAEVAAAGGDGGGVDRFRHKTGLPIVPYFSATKLAWMLRHCPEVAQAAAAGTARFGTIDCWLAYKLSGGALHVTDVSNAARTLLLDIHRLAWDSELCAAFGVPTSMLPRVASSSQVYGQVAEGVGVPLGGVPLASLMGDQSAALFGQAAFKRGDTKNTYGTGCFMVQNTGTTAVPSRHGLLTMVAYQLGEGTPPVYGLEGSVAVAGSAVKWLQDTTGVIQSSSDIEAVARSVPDSGGVVFVPAFTGLLAPHWDASARGTLLGLTRGTKPGHLARATLEAAAHQSADVLAAMEADSGEPARRLLVDGGMAVNDTLLQFQSDMAGRPVVRPAVTETTAAGAAFAAGLAVGFWDSLEDVARTWSAARTFTPAVPSADTEAVRATWHRAVERAKHWAGSAGEPASHPVEPSTSTAQSTPGGSCGAQRAWGRSVLLAGAVGALVGGLVAFTLARKPHSSSRNS